MNHPSIRSMLHAAPGLCGICGISALLKWKDLELGQSFGDCCRMEVILADRVLAIKQLGFIRPQGLVR